MLDYIKTKLLFMPVLASEHGKDVDDFIVYIHILMAALFVGWFAYFAYTLFRFRQSRQPKADYTGVTSHASSYIEFAVVVFEAVLLIGFAVPLWAKVADKFPDKKDATLIRLTAEQFSWSARYPGPDGEYGAQDMKAFASDNPLAYVKDDPKGKDDVTAPLKEIHVPVDRPVIVYLTSKDVIHSFKIAPMRVTQDAIPGMISAVHFKPTVVGKYLVTCAQLCGNGHSSMNAFFTVDTKENFAKWMAEKSIGGGATSFE